MSAGMKQSRRYPLGDPSLTNIKINMISRNQIDSLEATRGIAIAIADLRDLKLVVPSELRGRLENILMGIEMAQTKVFAIVEEANEINKR